MGTITVVNQISLDGVTQGLGRPDEDTRDGFAYGGWGQPHAEEVAEAMGFGVGGDGAMLLGRRTYLDFHGFWPHQGEDNPFTQFMNKTQKYVVSQTLSGPLPWQSSTLVSGDVEAGIRGLKDTVAGQLVVIGSGSLARSLVELGLVDTFVLPIYPLLLGQGRRLFADRAPRHDLDLVDTKVTAHGVIVATYAVVEGAVDRSA